MASMDKRKGALLRLAIIVGAVVVAAIIWVVYTNSAHVAIVNGERISRRELIGRLEEAYGEDVLSEMINEVLLRQAAKEAGVSVTAEEVDTEVAQDSVKIQSLKMPAIMSAAPARVADTSTGASWRHRSAKSASPSCWHHPRTFEAHQTASLKAPAMSQASSPPADTWSGATCHTTRAKGCGCR
jgi:hypothetical protein